MNVLARARSYGVRVEFADLGDWGADELRSEYDPHGPCVRINLRIAQALAAPELGDFVLFCVAHELYHHREFVGEVERLPDPAQRESAANAYARAAVMRS
ncbi:MAG: hypothetical protein ACLQPV_00105 [Vulcanimicrobiaceae bacterium]